MEWIIGAVVILIIIGAMGGDADKRKKVAAEQEALRRRKEAEDYIIQSGDQDAIKTLMLARANPANYSQVMSGGVNKGNDTLKTALGVMTGVVAGNLIANAITASVISSALDGMKSDLDGADHSTSADSSASGSDISFGGDD